jgi:hypothetical protein
VRYYVVVSGRNQQRGAEVVAEIRAAGGRADFIAADLDGSPNASRDLAREAARAFGGHIDVLVNNAGIFPGGSTAATDEGTFDQVYAVNLKAAFFLTAAVAPAMVDHGGGAIINLGSWIARLGIPGGSLYSSTKGAIETLTARPPVTPAPPMRSTRRRLPRQRRSRLRPRHGHRRRRRPRRRRRHSYPLSGERTHLRRRRSRRGKGHITPTTPIRRRDRLEMNTKPTARDQCLG